MPPPASPAPSPSIPGGKNFTRITSVSPQAKPFSARASTAPCTHRILGTNVPGGHHRHIRVHWHRTSHPCACLVVVRDGGKSSHLPSIISLSPGCSRDCPCRRVFSCTAQHITLHGFEKSWGKSLQYQPGAMHRDPHQITATHP